MIQKTVPLFFFFFSSSKVLRSYEHYCKEKKRKKKKTDCICENTRLTPSLLWVDKTRVFWKNSHMNFVDLPVDEFTRVTFQPKYMFVFLTSPCYRQFETTSCCFLHYFIINTQYFPRPVYIDSHVLPFLSIPTSHYNL